MASVYDHARGLVKALRGSDEARQLKRLAAKVKADDQLEAKLSQLRMAQFEVQATQLQGGKPSQQQTEQLQRLTREVESVPALREYIAAETAYGKMLVELQQVLAEGFSPEVAGALQER